MAGNPGDGKLEAIEREVLASPEWALMLEKTGLRQMTAVPIRINPHLNGRVIGRAWATNYIEISKKFYTRQGGPRTPEMMRVIKHEMVHILCNQNGLRVKHGKEFKAACGWIGLDKAECHESVYRYVARCAVCGKQKWKSSEFHQTQGNAKCAHCGNRIIITENVPVLQRVVAACMECSKETPKRYLSGDGRWVCGKCFGKANRGPKPARIILPKLVGPDGYRYLMQKCKRRPRMRIGRQSWVSKSKTVDGNEVKFWYDEMWGTYFYFQFDVESGESKRDSQWWKTPICGGIVRGYEGMEDVKNLTLWRPEEASS